MKQSCWQTECGGKKVFDIDHFHRTGEKRQTVILSTKNDLQSLLQERGTQGLLGMKPGHDESWPRSDEANVDLHERHFLDDEVLHAGTEAFYRRCSDPDLQIITREDWNKKTAESPHAK